jgi:hypothetical protein
MPEGLLGLFLKVHEAGIPLSTDLLLDFIDVSAALGFTVDSGCAKELVMKLDRNRM